MSDLAVYVAGWGLLVALLAFHNWYNRQGRRNRR